MQRRDFFKKGAIAAGALTLVGCGTTEAPRLDLAFRNDTEPVGPAAAPDQATPLVAVDSDLPVVDWDMATSWPLGLDVLFGGAQRFTDRVAALSGGLFTITARPAGEIAGGLDVFNVVQEGTVPAGHTAAYYYMDKSPALAMASALPFGLTARQHNAWLYYGGGQELLNELYAERFNMISFPAGNSGMQMGGWFNREIRSVSDLDGLRMRIPGMGGRVLAELGVEPVALGGGDIYNALETGDIDAAEFVGPHDDLKLGLHEVSEFYYYPGWWEPGAGFEVQFPLDQWNELPEIYQEIIRTAAHEANAGSVAQYDFNNAQALKQITDSDIELRPFPRDVMVRARQVSFDLYDDFVAQDEDFARLFESWNDFRGKVQAWHGLAESSYLDFVGSV